MNLDGFNAANIEPASRGLIPAGDYVAIIDHSEAKVTKSGQGQYLEVRFTIIEGDHTNRKLFVRLNLHNASAKAVEIARQELSAICRAVNVLTPKESADLHNRPLCITVAIRRRRDSEDFENAINKYAPASAVNPAPVTAAVRAAATPQAGGAPWLRK